MRVLVTGAKGQLGYDVIKELKSRNYIPISLDISKMDITDSLSVNKVITETNPDSVIHCAAYTAVDGAEDNVEVCRQINVFGTENVAKACKTLDIPMIYISTDYVFNGQGIRPWEPDDEPTPLNIYGQSKYEGELAVRRNLDKYFIIRVSWVFGINGSNFVKTMLNLGKTHNKLTVVDDQVGSPTYTCDLARLLVDMLQSDKYGIYHATNEGFCSWYEFACEIFKQAGMTNVLVIPVTSSVYPVKAKRPLNSRMSKVRLKENGFERLPTWQNALERFLKENMIDDQIGTTD